MITIFPHLDYEGFSWEYMTGKPSSDFAEAHRVVSMELLVDRSGGDAIGAETVEDWGLEAAHAGHLWVYVERVEIAVKSVQKCEVSFPVSWVVMSFRIDGSWHWPECCMSHICIRKIK